MVKDRKTIYAPGKARAEILVPCRRCNGCRKARRNHWAARALTEQACSSQTWFVTLTLGPEGRAAIFKAGLSGPISPYAEGEAKEQIEKVHEHKWIKHEMQKFWKRLRKAGFAIRYFAAIELHKDGTPHVHAMIFLKTAQFPEGKDARGFPLANEIFAENWGHGFTNTWLVAKDDNRRAFYVAKYLAKGQLHRLAASQALGRLHYSEGQKPAETPATPSPPFQGQQHRRKGETMTPDDNERRKENVSI